jgi:hypothetical protein
MTPAEFFAEAAPWARQVKEAIPTMFVSVVLAQWANETGYGGPDWSPSNNPGNVGDPDAGGQTVFPTLAAGVATYITTLQLDYYDAVRAATSPADQMRALGESPWAASHYGTPPGVDLTVIYTAYDLASYDSVAPEPVQLPQQKDGTMGWILNGTGQETWWVYQSKLIPIPDEPSTAWVEAVIAAGKTDPSTPPPLSLYNNIVKALG